MVGELLTPCANYFNYFTEIEERFQQRRGALLLLSTLDWALIETWRDAGIPLDAVLRGIDAAFDKHEARQKKGRMRKVNGLAWCAQAVMEAAEELREAAAGTAAPSAVEPRESGFEHGRVAAHLDAAALALEDRDRRCGSLRSHIHPSARAGRRRSREMPEHRKPTPTPRRILKPSNAPSASSKRNSSQPSPPPPLKTCSPA